MGEVWPTNDHSNCYSCYCCYHHGHCCLLLHSYYSLLTSSNSYL
jgi:hypothetical protein